MTKILPSKELSEIAQNKWDAFCAAAEESNIKRPDDPEFIAVSKRVFSFSDFISRSCIRDPEMLTSLMESQDLLRKYHKNEYHTKLQSSLLNADDDRRLGSILRTIRRREMVRIAWRDLAGWSNLSETMVDLSAFADACIDQTLTLLHQRQCLQFGVPTGLDNSHQRLVVIGMGKLGGGELNFSSDIDLIFAYPEKGYTKGGEKTISNDEFFLRLCRRMISVIGSSTPEGFVFRVDMRLRPDGENGPLVMSFDNMEEYYQHFGQEWERYAWIKARVVAGDKEAGDTLLNRLKPFVYRRYLDFGAFESLRDMKQKISLDVKKKGWEDDVKSGPGGIREIEFFGQVFQLIRGGVVPALQDQPILKILSLLFREKYISGEVYNELKEAYAFLRNVEHRLQEFSDQQTHRLPLDPIGRIRLVASMGFSNWEAFSSHLKNHMKSVHDHFNNLLETKDTEDEYNQADKIYRELKGLWQDFKEDALGYEVLSVAGFDNPDKVIRLLHYLRNDPETRALSRDGRERLDKLIPLVLKEIGKSEQPLPALNRILDLVKTIERRTCYISLLLENPKVLSHLVKLANLSPWIISFLAKHPVLLDEFLDPRTLYIPPKKSELEKELRQRLEYLSPEDLEYQVEELCIFKQINVLRVAAADVIGNFPLMKVSDHLSDIAETILHKVLDLSWRHLVKRHGKPICLLNGKKVDKGFAVISYGKLGGLELGYDSDLDLVFLHSGSEGQTAGNTNPIDNAQFFARLAQRVIHILTVHTRAGALYETDMRLRPSGSSGLIVSHVGAFRDYQMEKAWTWEHQALIKARAVSGDRRVAERFEQIRIEVLARLRSKSKLQKEVKKMRERMRKELSKPVPGTFNLKQDKGGIVDIEFMVQYLVLLKAHEYPELLNWTDNVRLLQTLAETGIIDEYTAYFLREAYLIYRASVHRLSLQEKGPMVPEDKFRDLRKKVQEIWNYFF